MTGEIAKAFTIFGTWVANNNHPKYLTPEDFNVHYHNYIGNVGGEMLNIEYDIFVREYLPILNLNSDEN